MLPDEPGLEVVVEVPITWGIGVNDQDEHTVVLCIAHGGHYWACVTCEAQGIAENVPPGITLGVATPELADAAWNWHDGP